MQGIVTFFKNGWGFAHVPDVETQDDVFLHHSEIVGNRRFLNPGEQIVFELAERQGKPYAKNIRKRLGTAKTGTNTDAANGGVV